MYEALAGVGARWNAEMEALWHEYAAMNAELFAEEFDVVVVHDPQPGGILSAFTERHGRRPSGRWVWHCHLDLSEAQPDVWQLMQRYCHAYDALAFDLAGYVPKPIEADASAEKQVPGLQLGLVATHLAEEPEMRGYYEQVARRAETHPDIFVLSSHSSLRGLGNVELNAFQRAALTIAQKSIRKGFWVMASDVLWKERPVVASPLGGIPRQVIDGETGYLARTVEEVA